MKRKMDYSSLETDKIAVEVIENKILRHTIQFFEKKGDKFSPLGSGVLAFIHDNHFILTCSHVASLVENENLVFVRDSRGGFISVLGEVKLTDIEKSNGLDLAYIKIEQSMISYLRNYEFIKIDKFTLHNTILDGLNYCALGFPEENLTQGNNGKIKTGASFFVSSGSKEKVYKYYKLKKEDFFLIEMNGKHTDLVQPKNKNRNKPTEFYGLSGGGLWLLDYKINPVTDAKTIDYKLIGILTEFRKGKYYCLIANKIHYILDAFTKFEGFKFRPILK
jgi:hypothetical protein